jgi:hypothetical protein
MFLTFRWSIHGEKNGPVPKMSKSIGREFHALTEPYLNMHISISRGRPRLASEKEGSNAT